MRQLSPAGIKRRMALKVAGAGGAAAMVGAFAAGHAAQADTGSSLMAPIVGSWWLRLRFNQSPDLPSFLWGKTEQITVTFAAGGGSVVSVAGTTNGAGTWQSIDNVHYKSTFGQFIFDSSGNVTQIHVPDFVYELDPSYNNLRVIKYKHFIYTYDTTGQQQGAPQETDWTQGDPNPNFTVIGERIGLGWQPPQSLNL